MPVAVLDIVKLRHIVEFDILSALLFLTGPEGCHGLSDWAKNVAITEMTKFEFVAQFKMSRIAPSVRVLFLGTVHKNSHNAGQASSKRLRCLLAFCFVYLFLLSRHFCNRQAQDYLIKDALEADKWFRRVAAQFPMRKQEWRRPEASKLRTTKL